MMYQEAITIWCLVLLTAAQGNVFISSPPRSKKVRSGQDVTFSCLAGAQTLRHGIPLIRWFKNKKHVVLDGVRIVQDKLNFSLMIKEVTIKDAGKYTCVANLNKQKAKASAHLIIEDLPDPPVDVRLVSCDDRVAHIEWKLTSDEVLLPKQFIIQYNTSFTPDKWQTARTKEAKGRYHDRITLSPWGNYSFRVIAQNELGRSLPSFPTREHCSTPPDVPHHNPRNVCTRNRKPGLLIITWDVMPPIDQNGPNFYYRVRWRRSGGDPKEMFQERILSAEINELVIPDQQIYRPYEIYVLGLNQMGKAAMMAQSIIGYTGEGVPAVVPQNFRLNPDKAVTNTSADFRWDAIHVRTWRMKGFFRGYKIQFWKSNVGISTMKEHTIIYQEPDPCTMGEQKERSRREANSGHVYNLWPYTNITAQILALNGKYQGPPSNMVHFTTREGIPSAVVDFEATEVGSKSIKLKWNPPADPNGNIEAYTVSFQEVGRKRHQDVSEAVLKKTGVTVIEVDSLKPVTKYQVTIWAHTHAGQGPPYTIEATTLPNVPELPHFTAISISSKTLNVSWQPKDSDSENHIYTIRYRRQGEEIWKSLLTLPDQHWARLENLDPGVIYDIRLVASNGHHTRMSDAQKVILPPILDQQVRFRVMYLGETSVGIQLVDDRHRFTEYYLTYKQTGLSNSQWLDTKRVSSEQWTYLQDLTRGATYRVKMIAYSKQGHTASPEREIIAGNKATGAYTSKDSAMSIHHKTYLSFSFIMCLCLLFRS